uniref:ATP synthase complex subunit 8 n=1 Tax=Holarthrothrips indicus TaxID=1965675 RepID=A0A8A5L5I4_9NEOP|nr:ATP synthase F0 subunit 8 [Holarthrothrips indicus]
MPQMSAINWLFMYMFFTITFYFFMSCLYFFFVPVMSTKEFKFKTNMGTFWKKCW